MNSRETQIKHEQIYQQRYGNLNPEQQKAVDTIEGPVLVVAGPGSGKTELLSLRTANILRQTDTLPSSILCLTFTDSASVNMQKRLESLIGPEAYKVTIHTFHSFGSEIIAQYPEYFYKGANYVPADEIKQLEILQEIFEELPHNSALCSYHPDQGFTYLKESRERIGDLKRSGLGPNEFRGILEFDQEFMEQAAVLIAEVFEEKISKNIFPLIEALIQKLSTLKISKAAPEVRSKTLQEKTIETLTAAVRDAREAGNTKPITEWKSKYTKKNDHKKTVLKDSDRLQKNFELANVYGRYIQKLHEDGLFDYDDMLLDVKKALETYPDLLYTLQEKFLYILVDEFQDTNGVQMRLLDLLIDTEINEGRPNIMAVGDDDQAIYKFQGANLENILGFHQKFRDPEIIVLTRNYRSTQEILNFARKIILQGEDRLETRLEGVQKELLASRKNLPEGLLIQKEFDTSFDEFFWVAQNIKKILEEKLCKPSEIAVLASRHRILETAAKTLNYFGIPVAYERKRNLLEDPFISEIITLLRFTDSMLRHDEDQADYLLPEILSFPFWGINRVALWKLSAAAIKSRKRWMDAMLASDSVHLKTIAKFLIDLAADAKESTAEAIIDRITGVEKKQLPNDEYDDAADQHSLGFDGDTDFRSPFKQFYFDEKKLKEVQSRYIEHLESLQAFIAKIRKHNGAETLYVKDVVKFVQLLKNNHIPLNHTLEFSTNDDSVQLMTVHKSKGLEFERVFVLNCQDGSWIRRPGDKLQFASNLPLSPENETPDDVLRLFYVALTRAKHHLYLTRHRFDEKGKEQVHLRFLSDGEKDKKSGETLDMDEAKERVVKEYGAEKFFELPQNIRRHETYSDDEKHLLKSVLQNYRLSVTHLTNFLNIPEGGPHLFVQKNLLRFPQMLSPKAAFGSAMHKALANFYLAYKVEKKLPSLECLQKFFTEALVAERLNKNDLKKFSQKGLNDLKIYYDNQHSSFDPQDKVEVNFMNQQVVVNGATLNGQIDRIHVDSTNREIVVYDYKTGKTFDTWEPTNEYLQFKAWQYKLQLIFYKLLVENSREYREKVVHKGVLEFLEPKNNEIQTLELEIIPEDVERLKKLVGTVYRKIMNLDFPDITKYDKDLFGIGCFMDDLIEDRV